MDYSNIRVHIVSGYGRSEILVPFGESLRVILLKSFQKIGVKVKHVYFKPKREIEVSDSIVLIVGQPEIYYDVKSLILGKNNKIVFWSLEPIADPTYENTKLHIRGRLVKQIMDDADFVMAYNRADAKILGDDCYFLPIGYHECLEPKKNYPKIRRNICAFVGHWTSIRRDFMKVVQSKLRKDRRPRISPRIFTYKRYISNDAMISVLSRYPTGLDLHATKLGRDHIRWHRIMMYCGAGLVLLTNSNLSKYGFVPGEDYLFFDSCQDFANHVGSIDYHKYIHDPTGKRLSHFVVNMREKIMKNFYMPKLLRGFLEKLNEADNV